MTQGPENRTLAECALASTHLFETTVEVKNLASLADGVNEGLRELAKEQANAGTTFGVCFVRRRGGRIGRLRRRHGQQEGRSRMKAVLITGSRHWADPRPIVDAIVAIDPNLIIEGGADGADFHARVYATSTGTAVLTWPDEHWGGYVTGPARNGYMVQVAVALKAAGWDVTVLAFPAKNSRGTWSCVNQARKAGLDVSILDDVPA